MSYKTGYIAQLEQELAHMRAMYEQQLSAERSNVTTAVELLTLLYDEWENGTPSYEEPEECSGFLGNAFQLSAEQENRILDFLKPYTETRKRGTERR